MFDLKREKIKVLPEIQRNHRYEAFVLKWKDFFLLNGYSFLFLDFISF
jgi:hypothetical protein